MTKYEEILEAFRAGLPRKLALSKAVEELPLRIRNALSTELSVPPGRAEFLSLMHKHDIPYVYLARPVHGEHGEKTWEPCLTDDVFFRDWDGVLHFGLGLFLATSNLAPFMLHSAIAIEDITDDAFTLVIASAPGAITVKIGDSNSYAAAAKGIADWMLAMQSDPRAALGEKAPIGFGRRP
jgi:hypothetical protein